MSHETRRQRWDALAEECDSEKEFMQKLNFFSRNLAMGAINVGYAAGWLQAKIEPAKLAVLKKIDEHVPELDHCSTLYRESKQLGYTETKERMAKARLRTAFKDACAAGNDGINALCERMGLKPSQIKAQLGLE